MNQKTRLTITGLLAISLLCKGASTGSVTNQPPKGKIMVELVCWTGVAAAASYVVYSVYRCAQAAGLTNAAAPPSTNGASASFVSHSSTGPMPPGGGTGTGGAVTTVATGKLIPCSTYLMTNSDKTLETKLDISARGWTDWQGHPYTWLFRTQSDPTGPHVQSSTNMIDWVDEFYTVNIWVSSRQSPDPNITNMVNMTMVVSDASGPILTNYSTINTNITLNAGVRCLSPSKYYRISAP